MRTAARASVALLAAAALAAGYVAADAADVVPGVLTADPLPTAPPPPPEPTAPGATPASSPAPVLPPPTAGSAPAPAALAAVLDPLLADPALGATSAAVVDVESGAELYARDAGTARPPASTAKLLTAAAALSALGPGERLPTRVVAGAGPDEVVLVGGGDVLLAPGPGDPAAVDGRAGLADLADQAAAALLASGRTSVALRLDDGLFTGPRTAPSWEPADVALGFVAPVTAVAVHAGRLGEGPYPPRSPDPALAAAQVLAGLLAERGVQVAGPVARVDAAPTAEVLAEVLSAPVEDVVALSLETSDNTASEALAALVAVETGRSTAFADAAGAVLDVVTALGVRTAGARLVDGSGLGDGSAVPVTTLVDVLRTAADETRPDLRAVLTGLPVAAGTGTLGERFAADGAVAAAGVVRAKTGSLRGVDSLAGVVVDAEGRLLAFAVLAEGAPATLPARAALDRVAAALAACGCR